MVTRISTKAQLLKVLKEADERRIKLKGTPADRKIKKELRDLLKRNR